MAVRDRDPVVSHVKQRAGFFAVGRVPLGATSDPRYKELPVVGLGELGGYTRVRDDDFAIHDGPPFRRRLFFSGPPFQTQAGNLVRGFSMRRFPHGQNSRASFPAFFTCVDPTRERYEHECRRGGGFRFPQSGCSPTGKCLMTWSTMTRSIGAYALLSRLVSVSTVSAGGRLVSRTVPRIKGRPLVAW